MQNVNLDMYTLVIYTLLILLDNQFDFLSHLDEDSDLYDAGMGSVYN